MEKPPDTSKLRKPLPPYKDVPEHLRGAGDNVNNEPPRPPRGLSRKQRRQMTKEGN